MEDHQGNKENTEQISKETNQPKQHSKPSATMEGEELAKNFNRMHLQDGQSRAQPSYGNTHQSNNYKRNHHKNNHNNNGSSNNYHNNNQKYVRRERSNDAGDGYPTHNNTNNSRVGGNRNHQYDNRRRNYQDGSSNPSGVQYSSKSQSNYSSSNSYAGNNNNHYQRRDHNNNNNNHRSKRHHSNNQIPNNNPFCFDITDKDMEVCERTAENMKELYSNIKVEPDILAKIQQLAINAEKFLQLQQQNVTEFYEEKRKHDINAWLATCTEEEQKRYWERMQKS